MAAMQKGQCKPLNVTQKAKHRIVVGLGWDPAEEKGLIGKVQAIAQGKETHHDLDLSCHIFNINKELIETISAEPDRLIDASEHIYHSGDNEEGIGEGDDEEISVELKNLPKTIHHILFTAKIKSGHGFHEINNPEIRLADAYTNHNLLVQLLDEPENEKNNFFIFCRLTREKDGWNLCNISTFSALKKDEPLDIYL